MTRAEELPAWVGATAGAGAAAAALAVGQLAAALTEATPSPVVAVANVVRDASPGWFTRWAISTFGAADKPLLVAGVAVASVAVAVALGIASRSRPGIGVLGVILAGGAGMWAMDSDPSSGGIGPVVVGVVAVVTGVVTLLALLAVAHRAPDRGGDALARHPDRPAQDPRLRRGDRRRFLTASTMVGAGAAVTALAGRTRSGAAAVSDVRQGIQLPTAPGAVAVARSVDRARADRVAATPGVSKLITRSDDFYRIDTALFVPQVRVDDWRLHVDGMVRRKLVLSYGELLERATTVAPVTLACVSNEVGGSLVGTAVWQGIPLAELLAEAGVDPEASQLVGRSVDGWTAGMPTAVALDGRTALVALGMNGQPLPLRSGFPARLVVSGLYGYVSATKWLRQLELTTWDDFDAYWVPRGWAKEAPVKTSSRIDTPSGGSRLSAGAVPVAGVAWAPSRGIAGVEVQVDDGPWQEADLGTRLSEDTWVQWRLEWRAHPGRHRLRVRATDRTGATQVEQRRPVDPDGATGWHTVEVEVR